jgi:hypothetical protein
VRLGNELGASQGAHSVCTVSDSLREVQGEQLSVVARDDAGAVLGDSIDAELGPACVLVLDSPLKNSTRRYRKARQHWEAVLGDTEQRSTK